MPPGGLLRTVWRHKVLVVVGLVMTAAAALAAGRLVGPTYTSEAVVVLLPPAHDQQIDNPYLYLGGIQQARDVVLRSLVSEQVRADIARAQPTASYDVLPDPLSEGPLLVVSVQAPTAGAATGTMRAVLDKVPPTVRSLQERMAVQRGADITPLTITADKVPILVTKSQLRAGIGVGVLGMAFTVFGIGLIDGPWARRREARRAARAAKAAAGGAEPAGATGVEGAPVLAAEPAVPAAPAAPAVPPAPAVEPEPKPEPAPAAAEQDPGPEHSRPVYRGQPRSPVPVKARNRRLRGRKRNLEAARGEAGS